MNDLGAKKFEICRDAYISCCIVFIMEGAP